MAAVLTPVLTPVTVASLTCLASTERDRYCKTAFGGFLVLRVHLLCGERERGDGRVEVDAPVRRNLVARDHVTGPRLHRTERTAFDARNLHESGDWITRHAEVML